jgi:ligand-binding sensor domain-containing protein
LYAVVSPAGLEAVDPNQSIYQYNCRTWRRDNGLPTNGVNGIAQTQDGRLWLGTSKGLIHFDGVEFRVVSLTDDAQVTGTLVTAVTPRADGGLWFGLHSGGFGWYADEKIQLIQPPEWMRQEVEIRGLAEGSDGSVFLASTEGAGRLFHDGSNEELLDDSYIDVFSVYEDRHVESGSEQPSAGSTL